MYMKDIGHLFFNDNELFVKIKYFVHILQNYINYSSQVCSYGVLIYWVRVTYSDKRFVDNK